MDKKLKIACLSFGLLTIAHFNLYGDEAAKGAIFGGLAGAALGGAVSGHGEGALWGGLGGAALGGIMGSAAEAKKDRYYNDYAYRQSRFDENEELIEKNEELIYEYKMLRQQYHRLNYMISQCKAGKINYRRRAQELTFVDDFDYDEYESWEYTRNIRKQNRLLTRANDKLRNKILKIREKNNRLMRKLRRCEAEADLEII